MGVGKLPFLKNLNREAAEVSALGVASAAFEDGFNTAIDGCFNLAVIGDAGAGKSTLVNAIFDDEVAPTGIGAPVTLEATPYVNSTDTFRLWDFPGFELGKEFSTHAILKSIRKIQKGPAAERIHAVWFCWNVGTGRLLPEHREVIAELGSLKLPVIGVLTKVRDNELDEAQEFADYIESQDLGVVDPIVFTRAKKPTLGLAQLLDVTREVIPDPFRNALEAAQKIDLKAKRRVARGWIMAAAASAAAAAVVPVPVATATLLAPIQLGMLGKITKLYGNSLRNTLGAQGIIQLALQLTGRAAAQSLVRLIPGAGKVINASVASAWTYAAGEAWIQFCEKVYLGELDPRGVKNVWKMLSPVVTTLFKEKLANADTDDVED